MNDDKNILGCFVSVTTDSEWSEIRKTAAAENGKLFRTYIWGEKGISDQMKRLNREDYGLDMHLILFQFYVNPLQIEVEQLKEIESYRKKEKSIGIPIIITDDNFFNRTEIERYHFLKESMLKKLDLVAEVIKKKKLDTNVELLKSDLENLQFPR
jgi:hypothetical protein